MKRMNFIFFYTLGVFVLTTGWVVVTASNPVMIVLCLAAGVVEFAPASIAAAFYGGALPKRAYGRGLSGFSHAWTAVVPGVSARSRACQGWRCTDLGRVGAFWPRACSSTTAVLDVRILS